MDVRRREALDLMAQLAPVREGVAGRSATAAAERVPARLRHRVRNRDLQGRVQAALTVERPLKARYFLGICSGFGHLCKVAAKVGKVTLVS